MLAPGEPKQFQRGEVRRRLPNPRTMAAADREAANRAAGELHGEISERAWETEGKFTVKEDLAIQKALKLRETAAATAVIRGWRGGSLGCAPTLNSDWGLRGCDESRS